MNQTKKSYGTRARLWWSGWVCAGYLVLWFGIGLASVTIPLVVEGVSERDTRLQSYQ